MTWIVPWNGVEYDVDPTELTGLELKLIKDRTGLSFKQLMDGVLDFDGDAIRALFWAVERRGNNELKFTDYAGPSVSVILPHLGALNAAMEAMGKALGMAEIPAPDGSALSPSTADTPEPSLTL